MSQNKTKTKQGKQKILQSQHVWHLALVIKFAGFQRAYVT